MTPTTDGGPIVAATARGLGVRVPEDIRCDADGTVGPNAGGLSVSPTSLWNLPPHRRPRTFGRGSTGHAGDAIYVTTPKSVSAYNLGVREDPAAPAIHAYVEPASRCLLARYQQNLGSSRSEWRRITL